MRPIVLSLVTAALWIGVVNKLIQVRRAPEDLRLRAVAGCLACLAMMFTSGLPPVKALLDPAGTGVRILVVNLGTMVAAYWLLVFFMYSVHGPAVRRSVRLQAVPLAVALVVAVVAWLLAPPTVRVSPADPANGTAVHATVFVIAAVGYMGYAQLLTLRWSVSYARAAGQVRLRRGLVVICVALTALLTACLTKATLAGAQVLTAIGPTAVDVLNSTYLALVAFGTIAFVVGFSYPAAAGMVAAVPVWRAHRRWYRELHPLWWALHQAFPDLALSRVPATGWRGFAGFRRTHRRFYRRVIEIRDGLVQLAPYYDREAAEYAEVEARQRGRSEMEVAAVVQATLIAHGLRLKAAQTAASAPHPVPRNGGPDLDSDARWLVMVSQSLAAALDRPPSMPSDQTLRPRA